jgi:hypothetical protein
MKALVSAFEAEQTASHAYHSARLTGHAWEDEYLALLSAVDITKDARERVVQAFAQKRGWRISRRVFTLRQMRVGAPHRSVTDFFLSSDPQLFAHPYYFRHTERPYRPAAIVAHLYRSESDIPSIAAEAALLGLRAERLAFSWWYPPNGCLAVCYTRALDHPPE